MAAEVTYNHVISHIAKVEYTTKIVPTAMELVKALNITESWATVCLNDYRKIKRDAYSRI